MPVVQHHDPTKPSNDPRQDAPSNSMSDHSIQGSDVPAGYALADDLEAISHPDNPVPPDVAEQLDAAALLRQSLQDRSNRIAALARPTEEERAALNANGSPEQADRRARTEVGARRSDRVLRAMSDEALVDVNFWPSRWDLVGSTTPPPPAPVDHSFWWATTIPFGEAAAVFHNDGLHFFGGPICHSGDLMFASFGAKMRFGLAADRLPAPGPSGLWISTPRVELFGGVRGYTGSGVGDQWSKCWLHRRQTLFQFGLGGVRQLGVANETETLIFEENTERSVRHNLPGFKLMPPVVISEINTAQTLWAELEVRFDIQLEGHGTLLWADPEVLLRTFQWPLMPLQ